MLRAKKQAESKKAAESTSDGSLNSVGNEVPANSSTGPSTSLLGIGGVSVRNTATGSSGRKSAAEIRLQKDIAELDTGTVAEVRFPNPNDLLNFEMSVCADSGMWKKAKYQFKFSIPSGYPHEPPKVKCLTKIFHPNIDLEGNVCLNILREEWNPVLCLNSVVYGIISLFYEPNPNDPLNKDAAELLRRSPEEFKKIVERTLRGISFNGESFPKLI